MSIPDWHEEPVAKSHDRDAFDCGDEALNQFLRNHARKAHEQASAKTFLSVSDADDAKVLGYYSVCPAAIDYERAPESIQKGLARHEVPVFRLARLAVHLQIQGRGHGGQLFMAAARRCFLASTQAGGVALLIDAKNARVAEFYKIYGAVPLRDAPLSLLVPFKTLQKLLLS